MVHIGNVPAARRYFLGWETWGEGTKDDRRVRVTDLSVEILATPTWQSVSLAVRHAAMLPAVHQEMWQKYGAELPSEDNLRWFLTAMMSSTKRTGPWIVQPELTAVAVAGTWTSAMRC